MDYDGDHMDMSFQTGESYGMVERELAGSGSNIGHRKMWKRLRKNHDFVVERSRVMECLQKLDPDEVEYRRKKRLRRRAYLSKGPNFI